MERNTSEHFTAFGGINLLVSGNLAQVALKAKEFFDANPNETLLIFDDATSHTVEVDFRGTVNDVLSHLPKTFGKTEPDTGDDAAEQATPRGPGRPKLGVIAREVTLLPRHWEWLNAQPGGASVALRKLVEEARRAGKDRDQARQAQEACFRFISVMAGNRPHFEEATRALFASDRNRFSGLIEEWPTDVRDHAKKLASGAFIDV